jgi:thioredoxin 1
MGKAVVVTDNTFEQEVLSSPIPVLVDFWAIWCGPCSMVSPIVEELADEYSGRLKVCKVDVDANVKYATQFGIRSIPTLFIFKDGAVAEQIIGAVSKDRLVEKLEPHL